MSMELKNRIKLGMGLLLVIAVGLAVYFGFFAAKAPAEIPDLTEHTGTVTVTHGNALLDARMDEADSAKLIELLAHARFSPNEEAQIQDYSGGIRILFADGGEITLLRGEEKVFARAPELLGLGLSVPQVTKIFLKLREMGVDVPADVYTIPYAVKMILEAKRRRDAGETLVLPRADKQEGGADKC